MHGAVLAWAAGAARDAQPVPPSTARPNAAETVASRKILMCPPLVLSPARTYAWRVGRVNGRHRRPAPVTACLTPGAPASGTSSPPVLPPVPARLPSRPRWPDSPGPGHARASPSDQPGHARLGLVTRSGFLPAPRISGSRNIGTAVNAENDLANSGSSRCPGSTVAIHAGGVSV